MIRSRAPAVARKADQEFSRDDFPKAILSETDPIVGEEWCGDSRGAPVPFDAGFARMTSATTPA
jgi:hypothetical protein